MGTREYLLEQAKNEGREEGREEGRVEGREEGRVEGREEGRAEGREEGREEVQRMFENKIRDFALRLKNMGYPQLEITKVTGLSKEEVDAL